MIESAAVSVRNMPLKYLEQILARLYSENTKNDKLSNVTENGIISRSEIYTILS